MIVGFSQLKQKLKGALATLFFRCLPRSYLNTVFLKGVNLIGYAQAEMGLGEALRNTAMALKYAQIPFLVRKLELPLKHRQENFSMQAFMSGYCRYGINCISINPDYLYRLPQWLSFAEWGRRYNVGYWFWELPNFPVEWRYARYLVDEVWVNTAFVADSVQQAHDRVFKIPFAVEFSEPAASYDRKYFRLPELGTHFLFSYDLNSSTARKNPGAVIEAFHQAFPIGDEPVVLVIKLINGEQAPAVLNVLKVSLESDSRICLIDQYLSTDEMRGLLRTADCYVSLHRAEGLGLGMAESMFLGKPVIATAYSGNMEYMNTDNALLVPYCMIPVQDGEYPFSTGQHWADPDVSVAAEYMRAVAAAPDHMACIGAAAKSYMQSNHSIKVMSQAIEQRLQDIHGVLGD